MACKEGIRGHVGQSKKVSPIHSEIWRRVHDTPEGFLASLASRQQNRFPSQSGNSCLRSMVTAYISFSSAVQVITTRWFWRV
jgi:hypothetical protein